MLSEEIKIATKANDLLKLFDPDLFHEYYSEGQAAFIQ
jgi:hypothetical protein